MSDIEIINVEVKITKRQMRALGWKQGKKIASRDDIRDLVNYRLEPCIEVAEQQYLAYRKDTKGAKP
jgi:hypothetical protein